MSALSTGLASVAALATLATAIQDGRGNGHAAPQDLGATFVHHCGHCHVPPDTAFAVDRAWLEQIHDTA